MTDNLAVTPSDFDSFCITAPADRRLPGGGGYQVCNGLYNVQRARFGQVDNLVTLAPDRTKVYNGVDINLFNASDVINLNTRYGATWLTPTSIIGGRFFKLSAQLDF